MTKIVSGMGGAQSGLIKSRTNLASRVGNDFFSHSGPRTELDEALTFYAPLHRDTQDDLGAQGTFTRASQGLYQPYSGADWRIAGDNVPRFESGRLLMEPAQTNVHECYNANPDAALSGWAAVSLSPGATFERVQDVAALASAGLGSICSSGYVFRLDNIAATGVSYVLSNGAITDGSDLYTEVFWRGTGIARNRLGGVSGTVALLSLNYERDVIGWGAVAGAQRHRIEVSAGTDLYFIICAFSEGMLGSPIITQGAAGSRAADALQWASPIAQGIFEQDQGMALIEWTPTHAANVYALGVADSEGLLSVNDANSRFLRLLISTTKVTSFNSFDSTNNLTLTISPTFAADDHFCVALRWRTGPPSALQVGYCLNRGAWTWATEIPYDGAYPVAGDILGVTMSLTAPKRVNDIRFYNRDAGTDWIEANFP